MVDARVKYNIQRALKYACFPVVLFAFFSIIHVSQADAATVYFSPSSGSFSVGKTVTTSMFVNTQGEAVNNADAVIHFPTELLEVVSISKSGSMFSLWVEDPAFSNSSGTITFNGGLPTPGYTGTSGKMLSVVFKVKNAGTATLNFSSAAVRANDGLGTDVLQGRGQAQFTLTTTETPPKTPPVEKVPPVETPPVVEAPPATGTPSASKISSPTHPNPGEWYSSNNPQFTWGLPSDIIGTKISVDHSPVAVPNIVYSQPISGKQLENLADGIWYAHVQLRNSAGWGGVSHFKFQIDTQPPKPFKIEVKEGKETANPQPTLMFKTTDERSGIDHYEIIIDQKTPIITEKSEYTLLPQDVGSHTIIVKAVDKAGGETLAMITIEIVAIEAPVITEYPHELLPGSIFSIKGTAVPETTVRVYIQKDKENVTVEETKSDREGKWVFIEVEPVKKGMYQMWVESVNASDVKSASSEKINVLVSPPIFIKIGSIAIGYLTTIITLVMFNLITLLVILWLWLIMKRKKKKNKKTNWWRR